MLYAGLHHSRKRLDFCLPDELGEKVDVGAAPPDADGLHGLTARVGRLGEPVFAAIESMNGGKREFGDAARVAHALPSRREARQRGTFMPSFIVRACARENPNANLGSGATARAHGVHAERLELVEAPREPFEVAATVAVEERIDVEAIDDRILVPEVADHHRTLRTIRYIACDQRSGDAGGPHRSTHSG